MPSIRVPPPFRGPTQGRDEIEVQGDTLRACLASADAQCPGLQELVIDSAGIVHGSVSLFVNGDSVGRDAIDTAVAADDRVEILTSVAGG
jgi:sulfur carrier protein ThiS